MGTQNRSNHAQQEFANKDGWKVDASLLPFPAVLLETTAISAV
jgi:hypothetical protein